MIRAACFAVLLTGIGGTWWFAAGAGDPAGADAAPDTPKFKPVMSVGHLMKEQDRHFDAMLEFLRDHEEPKAVKRMRHEALALAEMANINGYQKRAHKHKDYRGWAAQLKAQAIEFAALAKHKKFDEAKSLARHINKTCKTCHDKYDD